MLAVIARQLVVCVLLFVPCFLFVAGKQHVSSKVFKPLQTKQL